MACIKCSRSLARSLGSLREYTSKEPKLYLHPSQPKKAETTSLPHGRNPPLPSHPTHLLQEYPRPPLSVATLQYPVPIPPKPHLPRQHHLQLQQLAQPRHQQPPAAQASWAASRVSTPAPAYLLRPRRSQSSDSALRRRSQSTLPKPRGKPRRRRSGSRSWAMIGYERRKRNAFVRRRLPHRLLRWRRCGLSRSGISQRRLLAPLGRPRSQLGSPVSGLVRSPLLPTRLLLLPLLRGVCLCFSPRSRG